jgi:hypothetical protein
MLCLNHFGELSEAEFTAQGWEHGEAANLPWQVADYGADRDAAWLTYGLELPEAGMRFSRRIVVPRDTTTAHFEEEVENLRRTDSPLAYQQHVTLGPPFVEPGVTRVDLAGALAHTYPQSLGDIDPLAPDCEFAWPEAPGLSPLDVFPQYKPLCTMCTVALQTDEDTAFVAVSNPRLGLLIAYVFPVQRFPWTAFWYENCGLDYAPYDSKTLAWGMEFGTCAFSESRIAMLSNGPVLGRRRFGILPARTTLRTTYDAMLLAIPSDWNGVARVARCDDAFVVTERDQGRQLRVEVQP